MLVNLVAFLGLVPVLLLTLILPAALVILLQVWLCKKGKWLGLILPGLTLAFSLVLALSIAAFSRLETGSIRILDEHGNIVQQIEPEHHHIEAFPAALLSAAGIFLVFNVPTAVLGGIWLHYRNKSEWKEDLRRMNIQDLE